MRYFISSNFQNLSMNWENYVFHWKKWNFEPITNSVHTAEIKTLNESMECVVLHKQTTCEMKTLQVQVYIQQWFYEEQGAKLSC